MSSVQSVTGTTQPNALQSALSSNSTEIQDRFLKLLITQLKNQDPMNPMDNAQITSQMSQISTVGGIEKLNSTMLALSTSMLSMQSLQGTNLIGHSVLVEGSGLNFNGSAPVGGAVQLPQSVESLKVKILGPSKEVVRQMEMGAKGAGLVDIQWDGLNDSGAKVAAGKYSYEVTATSGGKSVPATPYVSGMVSSVSLGSGGVRAQVNGIGELPMSSINRIM